MAETKALHAVFASQAEARIALERLAARGVRAEDIEIRSSIPLGEDVIPPDLELHSRVPLLAVLGGLAGGAAANFMATLPLSIGSMSVVSGPPLAVVVFEGVAVGAILCSVGAVLFECGLPRLSWRPGPLDQHLADGGIVVAVTAAAEISSEWGAGAIAMEEVG